ncbi:NAD(P)/FAD-dependent oxidoreductase [Nocardioides kribbensis]|uniref:phytoene desaturase family protein n=1 Tax=Nocardioides kribbensis TaxID=305517 RepID=UPI0031E15167
MTGATYDALVIGSGPNGLVAANLLADAGWSVLVLEAQPDAGGAVRSSHELADGFVHDTFSAFYPFARASPVMLGLDLERHGLTWSHPPAVQGHPFPDGSWALLHRDRGITADLAERAHPGDGEAWLRLCADWDAIGPALIDALLTPFPPVRGGLGVLTRLRHVGGVDFVRTLLSPALTMLDGRLGGEALRTLVAGNAGHADIPLDAAGSGMLGLLLTMMGQTVGFPAPRGGAGELSAAMVRRLESLGGEVRCDAEVVAVETDRGRATGVRLRSGERYAARRAVVADVGVEALYRHLLDPSDVPARVARGLDRFEMDPATVKVDWALDGPIPWASAPEHAPGTLHLAASRAEMAGATAQVASGYVPAHPFMLAGQMTTADPTRSPAGTEAVWAYTHVPQQTRGDAAAAAASGPGSTGGTVGGDWGPDDRERFADRMQARFEELAPGFGSLVRARRVLGPRELEQRNANLVGGAVGAGTSQLHQMLLFRPVPGQWGRAETGVAGLYLGSAAAHPGGGVHGAPGSNAARAALAHARVSALTALPRSVGRSVRGTLGRGTAGGGAS